REPPHGRADAGLRDRVGPEGEQSRPQAAESLVALPRQRRGARTAARRGGKGAQDRTRFGVPREAGASLAGGNGRPRSPVGAVPSLPGEERSSSPVKGGRRGSARGLPTPRVRGPRARPAAARVG